MPSVNVRGSSTRSLFVSLSIWRRARGPRDVSSYSSSASYKTIPTDYSIRLIILVVIKVIS